MTTENEFLDAMHELGRAIMMEKWRLDDLARSLEDIGMEKLAERVTADIGRLEALFNRMQGAFADRQRAELREHEQFMGETLLKLLDNATASA